MLDTNAALMAAFAPEQLSRQIRVAIEAGPGFLSVISYWEVMIKSRLGKLDVGEPRLWWSDTLDALQLTPLPFRPEIVGAIGKNSQINGGTGVTVPIGGPIGGGDGAQEHHS